LEIASAPSTFGRTDAPKSGLEVVVARHHDTAKKFVTDQQTPATLRFQLAANKTRAFNVLC
jgi:hypothetical protein